MSEAELWKAVGRVLADRRLALKHPVNKVGKAIQRPGHRALNVATVRAIENGEPKNLGVLSEYCSGLGLNLADVIASVLPTATASAAAMVLAREYDRVMASPSLDEARKADVRAVLQGAFQLARAHATQSGDGPVAPAKKPSRSERAR